MLNTQLFAQVGLDSGALTLLGSVAHQLPEPGHYRVLVLLDEQDAGQFDVVVEDGAPDQVDIDLAAVADARADACGCAGVAAVRRVRPGGYLLLHVGSGSGRWAAVVSFSPGEVIFDSRRLDASDLFTATVLRPGRYQVSNADNGATATLEVRYPERIGRPYRPAEPVQVTVGREITPERIEVGVAQSQVYSVKASARIRIELTEPYDKPREGPQFRLSRRQP